MKNKCFKIIFIIMLFALSLLNVNAMSTVQNLALIENQIFGYENKNLSEAERLNKIESFVYGLAKQDSFQARLSALNADLGVETRPLQEQISSPVDYSQEPTDSSVRYPIVDNLEEALLSQVYANENIYKRLDRLEIEAYGKISGGALSERVDKLSALIPQQQKRSDFDDYMANNDEYNYFSPTTSSMSSADFNSVYDKHSSMSEQGLLSLEKEILGKTYLSDTNEERLSRLEKKLLHKEFSSEAEELRMDRLATVVNAQKTSKVYKENRFMQHLSTGVQIGGMLLMILAMIL